MQNRYRLFRRTTGIYFLQDNRTRKQESLPTRDSQEAKRLLHARNEAHRQPFLNLQIARGYLMATDPKLVNRTWQEVMVSKADTTTGDTRKRWDVAINDKAFDLIRHLPLVETTSDHLLRVLKAGTVSTNAYLRKIHNFAVNMDWLLKPVIPRREWPTLKYRLRRAITVQEHRKIIERERNAERRAFYELCWHLGGSQTDIANLTAEDVDWSDCTISYNRRKLEGRQSRNVKPPIIRFGEAVAGILRSLPSSGYLFPYLRSVRAGDRATEFKQRCVGLGISGVSLHSYRYAWAERARKCSYPQRFAQEALGHNSKAVHYAYSKNAQVEIPALDQWEKQMQARLVEVKFKSHDGASLPEIDGKAVAKTP